MTTVTYRTIGGETVDSICHSHYGSTDEVETVLAANPGLSAHGPVLPVGLDVVLPDLRQPEPTVALRSATKLWD